MNDAHLPEPDAATSTTNRVAANDQLEHWKRASLRNQALRAAWQLGAVLRRVEREAPEVHGRLRSAVEALQLLSARLALPDVRADSEGAAAGPMIAMPRSRRLPTPAKEAENF